MTLEKMGVVNDSKIVFMVLYQSVLSCNTAYCVCIFIPKAIILPLPLSQKAVHVC